MGVRKRGRGRRIFGAIVAIVLAVSIGFAVYLRGPGPMDFAGGKKVALSDYRGADPTSVPASIKSEDAIKRGEYLTRASDCMVCHTARGGEEYAGGFAFTLPFGTIYSTNITPDKETGIGNYSDQDFLAAMHRGVRKDGARLYPAMPFASYTYMTDEDALAIKAYLFSLAPVRAPAQSNALAFPFDQRWLLGAWSAVFNRDTRFQADESKTPEWNRGAYLAEALAHCGECHTPRNLAYALDNRRKFGGAETGGWRAYNISEDAAGGIGKWSDEELVAYLATGHARGHGTASGPMGEAVSESFSRMIPDDVRAIATYARSVPAISTPDLPATLAPPAPESHREGVASTSARGKQVFEGACASCHGWTGVSDVSPYATLTGSRALNDPSAINVAQMIISGSGTASLSDAPPMPAFGDSYSNAEIADVANYLTARFGSKGSSIGEKDVANLRRQAAQ